MMFSLFDEACAYAVLLSHVCRNVYKPDYTPGDVLCKLLSGAAGCLACVPMSVKDWFDGRGQVAKVDFFMLAKAPEATEATEATEDYPAVARLRASDASLADQTNMAEFAFSRVGINPHYGKPFNPADLNVDCIPRGFSFGAEASVANGAALLGLGSDTGGPIRVPATLCGVVEF